MKKIIFFLLLPLQLLSQAPGKEELNRWEKRSRAVTIVRDQWGIPHVYGKSDADCVFGLMYAQSEDDFERIEMNYLEKLGRMAEVKGEPLIYEDLLNRLVLDSAEALNDYNNAPPWLRELLIAFADGMNYYLYRNPGTKPYIIHHFEPWFPLMWTDGSISSVRTAGISIQELKAFYTGEPETTALNDQVEPPATGSNGFAIGPSRSASGHALLYINPHVSFYFRAEVQMVSEQGLNSYGAVTWGQFFVYQGFNAHCGWMHTTSAADAEDLYIEKISKRSDSLFYEYENKQRPVVMKNIRIAYQSAGGMKSKTFRALFTDHGPIMAKRNGNWLSLKAINRTMDGLIQSWLRIKTNNFEEFLKTLELKGNSSNNTVYADDKGNIAYWHGNYMPVRDNHFDWSKPVEGSIAGTEWKGV
ncbi:MAG: penicillin acylase family protein, partial [Chitinophagales bacterium]